MKLLTASLFVVIVFAAGAVAQDWTQHVVDAEFDGAQCVHAADLDADGDIDILGASPNAGDLLWWENADGTGTTWTEHILDDQFLGACSVVATDLDDDGDLDVLGAGSYEDTIIWWENLDGQGGSWAPHMVAEEFDMASCVCAADVDGDGDLDVLGTATNDDLIMWWENFNGAGTSWVARTIRVGLNGAGRVQASDLDGDGDQDVLATGIYDTSISWWENADGLGTSWTEHVLSADFGTSHSLSGVDIDADGDNDILCAQYAPGSVLWWENVNGDGSEWADHFVDTMADGARSVKATDIDNDGDLDLIGAVYNAQDITWWTNEDGVGTTWTTHVIDSWTRGAWFVDDADFNGDGDMDIVSASFIMGGDYGDIIWWQNPGDLSVDSDPGLALPGDFCIARAYPNPFNPGANVVVSLAAPSDLHVQVHSILGHPVATLAAGRFNAGEHEFKLDGSTLASGVYFVRATVPGRMDDMQKLVLLR